MRKIFAITYALIIGIVAGITTASIMGSVAITPAYAKINSCPAGQGSSCFAGGEGGQGGGSGGHTTFNGDTSTVTQSGGIGHQGGVHVTFNFNTGQFTCHGSLC
jgi:hypothetical protein